MRDVFAPRPGFHWLRGHCPDGSAKLGGAPGVFFRNDFGRWFDIDTAYDAGDVEVSLVAPDDRDVERHYIGPVTPP